ncbi:MAG: hypothetical protein ACSHYF_13080 [Verrucomicrobiaceae bacterium]
MLLKWPLLLTIPIGLGLVSCSSTKTEESPAPVAKSGGEYHLNEKNPFEWSASDVMQGKDGTFEGGKRSHFENQAASSFNRKRDTPSYFSREYHSKKWNGSKDYSTGSYQVNQTPTETGKRSWFGGKKSSSSGKSATGVDQSYATGSYRTGTARETGSYIQKKDDPYTAYRQKTGARPIAIFSKKSYRNLSVNQSRSLLGKP